MRIINEDWQGWPEYAYSLREILKELGLRVNGSQVSGEIPEKVLDSYVAILEDDGMGYGINKKYVTCVDTSHPYLDVDLDKSIVNIFRTSYDKEKVARIISDTLDTMYPDPKLYPDNIKYRVHVQLPDVSYKLIEQVVENKIKGQVTKTIDELDDEDPISGLVSL